MRRSGGVQGDGEGLADNQIAGHGTDHLIVGIEAFNEGHGGVKNAGQRLWLRRQ